MRMYRMQQRDRQMWVSIERKIERRSWNCVDQLYWLLQSCGTGCNLFFFPPVILSVQQTGSGFNTWKKLFSTNFIPYLYGTTHGCMPLTIWHATLRLRLRHYKDEKGNIKNRRCFFYHWLILSPWRIYCFIQSSVFDKIMREGLSPWHMTLNN